MFTSAQSAGLEATEFYARKVVNPVLNGLLNLKDRERIFVGLFHRMYAYWFGLVGAASGRQKCGANPHER